MTAVTIGRAISGRGDVAFGGYVAGLLGAGLGPSTKVNFQSSVPLEVPLRIERAADRATLDSDTAVLATAEPIIPNLDLPPLPSVREAETASARFEAEGAPVPMCFGCGSGCSPGQGLRIFAGEIPNRRVVAALWCPHRAFGGEAGSLRIEFVWAALDCPSGLARHRFQAEGAPGVTAYLAALVSASPPVGEPALVLGWPIRRDGRKARVGSALITAAGQACAVAETLWIDLPGTGGAP